jgi:hypothetical protein
MANAFTMAPDARPVNRALRPSGRRDFCSGWTTDRPKRDKQATSGCGLTEMCVNRYLATFVLPVQHPWMRAQSVSF